MFKIIETMEKGRKELTIVPQRWEQCGTLFWPKKFAYKFQRDADSAPEPNWISIKCKVERNFLASYELAEEELDRMVDAENTTETEEETISTPSRAKRAKVLLPKSKLTVSNNEFNDLANSCIVLAGNTDNYLQTSALDKVASPITLPIDEYHQCFQESNVVVSDEVMQDEVRLVDIPQMSHLQDDKLNTIIITLNRVIENQHKSMKEQAKMQVAIHNAMKRKADGDPGNTCRKNYRPIAFEPIDTKEALEEFNNTLKNNDIFNEYVERLSVICGLNSKTKAIDHCYMLVDKFFTRNFFTLCAWAGGAKTPYKKFSFKFYENVIALFCQLINLADPRFTLEECEDFFKSVIRNCIRRNNCLNKRTPKSKNRPKKLSYNLKDKENTAEEENESQNTKMSDEGLTESVITVQLSRENTENP